MTISDDQSYSLIIRDILFNTIAANPYFSAWNKRRTKAVPIQTFQFPFLGVYRIEETMTPDGLGNSGEVRFRHLVRYGLSFIVVNNDQDAAERNLDHAWWIAMNALWRDPYIMNLWVTWDPSKHGGNPDNVRIESIERGTCKFNWGSTAGANETPLGELQYEVTCCFRTEWAPNITDAFLEMDVSTNFPVDGTEEEQAGTAQITAKYLFTAPPSAVANLITTDVAMNQVGLAWDAATGAVDGYVVQHSLHGLSQWRTYSVDPETSERVRRLYPSTPYDFRVYATGEGGDGLWSNIVEVTTASAPVLPSTVTGLAAGTVTNASVDLSWDEATGDIDQYKVNYAFAGSGNWSAFPLEGNIVGTSITVVGLAASTAYDFRVAASGLAGDGGWSGTVTATTTA